MSITVYIDAQDEIKGVDHVVRKLRQGGIPCRVSVDGGVRLCMEWSVVHESGFDPRDVCLGYGVLTVFDNEFVEGRLVKRFVYDPPAPRAVKPEPLYINPLRDDDDPNVIDVEAREIIDTPLLTNDQRP